MGGTTKPAIIAAGDGFSVWYRKFQDWYTYDRHVENVHLTLSTHPIGCPDPNFPVGLDIVNSSGRTLERVVFKLSAKRSGHRTDLVENTQYAQIKDDHILSQGRDSAFA